jgi:hypothetical protein
MRKFAKKCLLFLTLIFSSIGILNYFYINTNHWKYTFIDQILKFNNVPEHIQFANVGSSHGVCGFDYSNVQYQSFNFALDGQFFLYDYALLKQYKNRFDKNAILLIPISYFQITRIKTDFIDQRARYYRFLEKEHIDIYSIREKILFSFVPVLMAGDTLRLIFKDIDIPQRSKFMTEAELIKYCNEKHRYWTTDSTYEYETGEEGFTHNKFLVSQIIELCYTNNIRPVLVSTPITSILNNIYAEKSPGFFDTFYRFTHELQETYPDLHYFDYSHDPRFENDFSLFVDGDHLNTAGAEKFTAIVISDLQASGLLGTK